MGLQDNKGDGGPVDEGEIMFVDPERGMLNTKSGMALNFHPNECRGFEPAARNIVGIERIEGMNAFGLTLVAEEPAPIFSQPTISEGAVEHLISEAQQAPSPQPMLVETLSSRLADVDWTTIFAEVNRKEDGLDPQALAAALAGIQRPFERDEIEEMLAIEPEIDSLQNSLARVEDRWPDSWLSFLSWSNGGDFINGDRAFQDMLSVDQVREYTTCYGVAALLPGAIPFAMDGGGSLYMFDTREAPISGEYPIVFCHSSEIIDGWDAVTALENSFLVCCRATTDHLG